MRNILTIVGLLAGLVGCPVQPIAVALPTGRTLRDALRRQLRAAPSLMRYYTFTDLKAENLTFEPGKANGQFEFTAGRWPEQRAVKLDRGWLQGTAADATDKGITVACWFRCSGMGGLTQFQGKPAYRNGGIVAVGSGYWDGWRIVLSPQYRSVTFSIGRAKVGAVSAMCRNCIELGRWHHLAVTWDWRYMNVYLDGHLRAETPYKGPYTPSRAHYPLRIGEIGYGVGTIKLEVAELAIFGKALTPKTIARMADPLAPQADAIIACLMRGDRAAKSKQGSTADAERQARAEYAKILALDISDNPTILRNYMAIARLRIAQSFHREGSFDDARREYAALTDDESVPLHYRARAMTLYGDTYRDQRRYTDARAACKQMLEFFTGKHENWRVEAIERIAELQGLKDGEPFRNARQRRIERISHPARTFYVAPNGDDANPGTKDQPFASLEGARNAVHEMKSKSLPKGGITVYLRGGVYQRKKSFELTEADSGTYDAPIVYRALPREKVIVSGGVEVHGFQPVTDADAPDRLTKEARQHVVVLDLKDAGVKDFGSLKPRGFGLKPVPAHLELFFNGEPMQLARWPNPVGKVAKDFVTIADFSEGAVADFHGKPMCVSDGFVYSGPRPARWLVEPDVWLFGYWSRWYAGRYLKISAIDPKRKVIQLSPPWTYHRPSGKFKHGGYLKGAPYFAINLLCELDMPGEWYLDRETGKLYFWPPYHTKRDLPARSPRRSAVRRTSPIENSRAVVSLLEKPLVTLRGASHVVFRNITFEAGRADGIVIHGGEDVLIAGCVIRNMGNWGVIVDGGRNHGVIGCDIYYTGDGGVSVKGGDVKTLTPSGHFIENCHIHHFDRWNRAGYQPGISLEGVGHRVAHCLIHDGPHQAVLVRDNDHVFEYNEVHDTPYEAREMGLYYMYGSNRVLAERGNVARYNYFHHVPYTRALEKGFVGGGRLIFHIDHMNGGMTIYGNIFHAIEAPSGCFFSGGRENLVENNIFYRCTAGITLGDRSWVYGAVNKPPRYQLDAYLRQLHVDKPPWSTRYPQLAHLLELPKEQRPLPENNLAARNIAVNVGDFIRTAPITRKLSTIEHNWDDPDPGFADPDHGDFTIRSDSRVFGAIGFDPIPVKRIGLYKDELRATWPVHHEVDTHEHGSIKRKPLKDMLTFVAKRRAAAITIDGRLESAEWDGLKQEDAAVIDRSPNVGQSPAPPSYAWIYRDDQSLYIGVINKVNPRKPLTRNPDVWWRSDMMEVIIEGQSGASTRGWWPDEREHGPLFYLVGDFRGNFDSIRIAGLPREPADRLRRTVEYAARVVDAGTWTAEWRIPFASICVDPVHTEAVCFNIGVNKPGTPMDASWPMSKRSVATWVAWVGTGGPNWEVWNAGRLLLGQ